MKQIPGSKNCIAVVAAMAFNCKVEEFEAVSVKQADGSYTDFDFLKFALNKGYFCGVPVVNPEFKNKDSYLDLRIPASGLPALAIVNSLTRKESRHAIYWDGSRVHDPNPYTDDFKQLECYTIHSWYPLIKMIIQ